MRQLEDNVFYKSLSLPWGSFQPQYTCVVWNKWFEISPYFNFYLHYSKTKVKYYGASLCKYQSSKMKLSYHTKGLIDHLWPYLLNFLDYIYFSHFSLQNFFINNSNWKVFKILKTSLEACFFWQINVQKRFTISVVRTKSQSTWYINNNYTNVMQVFEDHIKFKNRTESLLIKRIGRKFRLI